MGSRSFHLLRQPEPTSKFHSWKSRYGQENNHNGKIPRGYWLDERERQAILDFHDKHPREGYRRLAFMMLDEDIVGEPRLLPESMWDATEAIEFERPRPKVRVTKYPKYTCLGEPTCGISIPERPPSIVEGNKYAPGIAAHQTSQLNEVMFTLSIRSPTYTIGRPNDITS